MSSRETRDCSLLPRALGRKAPRGSLAWYPGREYITAYLSRSWAATLAPTSRSWYESAVQKVPSGLRDCGVTIVGENGRLDAAGPFSPFDWPASTPRQDYHRFGPGSAESFPVPWTGYRSLWTEATEQADSFIFILQWGCSAVAARMSCALSSPLWCPLEL